MKKLTPKPSSKKYSSVEKMMKGEKVSSKVLKRFRELQRTDESIAKIVAPELPICSVCRDSVNKVIEFLATSSKHGSRHPSNRGASRKVRICRRCLGLLIKSFKKN